MVSKPSCWGIFFVKAQTKIGPVSQQTLNILTKTKLTTKKTNIFFFLRGKNSLTYKTTKRILPLREVHQTSSPKIYLQSYAIYLNSPNSLNFFKRKWQILIHFKTYTPQSSAIDGDCYPLCTKLGYCSTLHSHSHSS